MGERNRDGFLTVDSLKTGSVDQYAVERGGQIHTVELGMHPQAPLRPFYLRWQATHKGIVVESRYQTYTSVDEARNQYRSRIRTINA